MGGMINFKTGIFLKKIYFLTVIRELLTERGRNPVVEFYNFEFGPEQGKLARKSCQKSESLSIFILRV